jgi:type IV pilus assembly protein PilQ
VDFEKELGALFGLSKPHYLSGTFQGANSLAQGTALPNVTNAQNAVDPTQRLNFNNPAVSSSLGGTPGSIAIAVAKVGGQYLDLQLSALEAENHLEIIASPHVMTSNQQKATIQQGVEIPYQASTSSGATSVSFQNAVLSLEITPQITPNNKIILLVKASNDTQGQNVVTSATAGSTSTSIPSINTESVSSSVILNNNETAVLGGIYTRTKIHQFERIPVLGDIPIIGALFRNTTDSDKKSELLIFLTPKVIDIANSTTTTTTTKQLAYKEGAG